MHKGPLSACHERSHVFQHTLIMICARAGVALTATLAAGTLAELFHIGRFLRTLRSWVDHCPIPCIKARSCRPPGAETWPYIVERFTGSSIINDSQAVPHAYARGNRTPSSLLVHYPRRDLRASTQRHTAAIRRGGGGLRAKNEIVGKCPAPPPKPASGTAGATVHTRQKDPTQWQLQCVGTYTRSLSIAAVSQMQPVATYHGPSPPIVGCGPTPLLPLMHSIPRRRLLTPARAHRQLRLLRHTTQPHHHKIEQAACSLSAWTQSKHGQLRPALSNPSLPAILPSTVLPAKQLAPLADVPHTPAARLRPLSYSAA